MSNSPLQRDPFVFPASRRVGLSEISSADIAPLEKVLPVHCPDTWREFAHSIYLTLLRRPKQKQSGDELAVLAFELVQGIAQDLGGAQFYLPFGHAYSASARAAAIRREFNGKNHRRLAATYGVSESRIRQILAGK